MEQVRLKLAELESNQEGPKQKARLRRAATQRAKQMKVYYVNDLSSDSETGKNLTIKFYKIDEFLKSLPI